MKKIIGKNKSILEQIAILEKIILKNKKLKELLTRLSNSDLKNYYVAAGCINQTIFNYYHDYELDYGINDFDIVYYDDDLSYEKEDEVIKYIKELTKDMNIDLDIKNEARVHLWYEEKYGQKIEPYTSLEDAISSWGTTITCIGVRLEKDKLVVFAPYGLNDLFDMNVRPIKKQFTQEQYLLKTKKWQSKWPQLKVSNWN